VGTIGRVSMVEAGTRKVRFDFTWARQGCCACLAGKHEVQVGGGNGTWRGERCDDELSAVSEHVAELPVERRSFLAREVVDVVEQPMITAVSELEEDRVVAEWTAWVNTPEAPGGRNLTRPFTSRFTVVAPAWTSLIRPSSAIRAGNRARNQW
jgi:hypothetical protein